MITKMTLFSSSAAGWQQNLIRWLFVCVMILQPWLMFAHQLTPVEVQTRVSLVGNPAVTRFYESQKFQPVWIQNGQPNEKARQALQILDSYAALEFPGVDFKAQALASAFQSGKILGADVEVQISDSFLLYLQHRTEGLIPFQKFYPDWKVERSAKDSVEILKTALRSNNLQINLKEFPTTDAYSALRKMLLDYSMISDQGGWEPIPAGEKLSLGMTDSRVPYIRRRLQFTNDLTPVDQKHTEFFDEDLDRAVRKFQERHGLVIDGIVGSKSVAEMNVPVQERIWQLQINLERLRWMPAASNKKYAIVNVPAFELEVYESGKRLFQIRAIVGRRDWCTPVFVSSKITKIILNPYWNVPRIIAVKEILGLAKKDPNYLGRNGIKVFLQNSNQEVPEKSINWSQVSARNFPYQFRQDPGAENSLGQIKFMFPNNCACYIHDTPNKKLFEKNVRTLSHGCVRIENPFAFASFLLGEDPSWNVAAMQDLVQRGIPETIDLPDPCPIYLIYLTAWVDNNRLHFRPDIYEQDRMLAELMNLP
jgi:murein L,D-transpeptidase YcbB/YkuD